MHTLHIYDAPLTTYYYAMHLAQEEILWELPVYQLLVRVTLRYTEKFSRLANNGKESI